ncbi:MAG: UDP-N-acetylmuramoyl-L-alanine--D-glutamate ligase [Kiritimatiellae bacterium]|nr:UDP-N-acetylmuramoyl-L-alanine--D-glutamate ligase [Kiritimatiellia bacterium]
MENKSALVLGYGCSGKAAEKLLSANGFSVCVWDEKNEAYPNPDNLNAFSFAVLSPGISLESEMVKSCRASSLELIGELSLAARYWKGRTVAITGSKGKSSVVKLIADTLSRSGKNAVACGNYGVPFSDVAFCKHSPNDIAVVEVSTFQMESVDGEFFKPDFAALINLQEDHIDRHGTLADYHALKLKMLKISQSSIVAQGCMASLSDGRNVLVEDLMPNVEVANQVEKHIIEGSYFDNGILHKNLSCAVALMRKLSLSDDEIKAGLDNFIPLPHRMCKVCQSNGVEYFDDSKATSLSALAAAIEMTPENIPVRLIAGGLAKGDDPKKLVSLLAKRVKKVYLIGKCAKDFFDTWKDYVPCEIYGIMECAVDAVMHEASAGERVLLSPGTASFDQFKSYGERGDVFANLVRSRLDGTLLNTK